MLVEFTLENYKSFKERATFSMEALKADKRHPENIASIGVKGQKILKTAAVYGANASGKTKLFEAMNVFGAFVVGSHGHADNIPLYYAPFAFDDTSSKKPTCMEMKFISEDVLYDYGFSYDAAGIVSEFLYYYPKGKKTTVFKRDGQTFEFTSDKKFQEDNSKRVRKVSLYVSVSAQFNHKISSDVVNWFSSKFVPIVNMNPVLSLNTLIDRMETNERFSRLVKKAFKIADFGITDIRDRNRGLRDNQNEAMKLGVASTMIQDIWIKHSVGGVDKELPLGAESSGTIRFLTVIGNVVDALMSGKTIVLDELDLSFHTDVCQWLVGLFSDPVENPRDAQLIFNTHDVGLLDLDNTRRDQIWLTIKDWNSYSVALRRLSDYKVRNDLDIRRAYLNGSFGAIPFIAPKKLSENASEL